MCNQCGVTLDGAGKLTSLPGRQIIGINCCARAEEVWRERNKPHTQPIGSEVRCVACGQQSGRDARDPEPRGMSRREYFAQRGHFMPRVPRGRFVR
jgi:hypothetical protein